MVRLLGRTVGEKPAPAGHRGQRVSTLYLGDKGETVGPVSVGRR